MSIDPAILSRLSVGCYPPSGKPGGSSTAAANFEKHLEDFSNTLKNHEKSIPEAIEQVKLAQLKLLQGIFSAEDEERSDSTLSGFGNFLNLQRLSLQQSQIVDRYARQQHYSVSRSDEKGTGLHRLIDRIAEKVSLAPALIHSVVTVESGYNPAAVSRAGAQGLMQLMPGTAAELGVTDSFDPEQNLLAGSKYLRQLLDKYDGDLDHALAAYNWGQGNVDRHGLDKMPQETRNYLAKIKSLLRSQPT